MDLPVEIWMRVFEGIRQDDYTRPAFVRLFNFRLGLLKAVQGTQRINDLDDGQAVEAFPPFEK